MTKLDCVKVVKDNSDLSLHDSRQVVDALVNAFMDALRDGDTVSLAGFGIIRTITREARTARDPRTGESVDVPEKKYVKFSPSINLKKYINE